MSYDEKTGGSAFPATYQQLYNGMTLLDYFAGQALMGLLARKADGTAMVQHCSDAYFYAEAMLAEKKRREHG